MRKQSLRITGESIGKTRVSDRKRKSRLCISSKIVCTAFERDKKIKKKRAALRQLIMMTWCSRTKIFNLLFTFQTEIFNDIILDTKNTFVEIAEIENLKSTLTRIAERPTRVTEN